MAKDSRTSIDVGFLRGMLCCDKQIQREPKFVVVHDGEREEGRPREERLERLERVARARSLARQGPRTNSPLETRRSDGGADTPARPWPCCRPLSPVACVHSMQEAFFESSLSVTSRSRLCKSVGASHCKKPVKRPRATTPSMISVMRCQGSLRPRSSIHFWLRRTFSS